MFTEFAVLTIEPRSRMGYAYVQDFVIDCPEGQVLIGRDYNSTDDIDTHEQNSPSDTLGDEPFRKKMPGATINEVSVPDTDCLLIPSSHISAVHARIRWDSNGIAITPCYPLGPGNALPITFVNEEVLSEGQLRILRPGDIISFHTLRTTQPFCRWEVKRIAYGGLQPKWSLDIPTVLVTAVAMAILGGLLILFLPDADDDFIN